MINLILYSSWYKIEFPPIVSYIIFGFFVLVIIYIAIVTTTTYKVVGYDRSGKQYNLGTFSSLEAAIIIRNLNVDKYPIIKIIKQ